MKLATLRDGAPDGRLVVVSHDLTLCSEPGTSRPRCRPPSTPGTRSRPSSSCIARGIEAGGQPVQRFHERDALAALPRAYQRADASAAATAPAASPRPAPPPPPAPARRHRRADRRPRPRGRRRRRRRRDPPPRAHRRRGRRRHPLPRRRHPGRARPRHARDRRRSPPSASQRLPALAATVARAARDRALVAGSLVVDDPFAEAPAGARLEFRDADGRSRLRRHRSPRCRDRPPRRPFPRHGPQQRLGQRPPARGLRGPRRRRLRRAAHRLLPLAPPDAQPPLRRRRLLSRRPRGDRPRPRRLPARPTPTSPARALRIAQAASDRRLVAFCDRLRPPTSTPRRRRPRRRGIVPERTDALLAHLFQHQIHHRGQAHAMLAGTPVPPPQLDEFFLDFDRHRRRF